MVGLENEPDDECPLPLASRSASLQNCFSRTCSLFGHCCRRNESGEFPVLAVLLFGQVLSFVMASAGAAQGTLELDCHLSAPSLSVAPFYLCLALGLIPLYFFQRKNERGQSLSAFNDEEPNAYHESTVESAQQNDSVFLEEGQSIGGDDHLTFSKSVSEVDDKNLENSTSGLWQTHDSATPGVLSYTFLRLIPLSRPVCVFLLVALADFYANYCTVMAFRYTTITSVALTDALAIPSAMLLACCWFRRRYSKLHFVGIFVCMLGIALNVFQDYEKDRKGDRLLRNVNDEYPHKALGDMLGLVGGILFGVSNTAAEYLVRDRRTSESRAKLEYLSMLGFFAIIFCALHVALLERSEVKHFFFFMGSEMAANSCSPGKVFGLWMGFSSCGLFLYIGNARFLQISEGMCFVCNFQESCISNVTTLASCCLVFEQPCF